MIRFGPGGNDSLFYSEGNKESTQMPAFLSKKGLNAYEYQCNRGVRISEAKAKLMCEEAKKYDIDISVHAPYYISLSSQDEEKRINSIKYITDSMNAVKLMGGNRVVVHAGSVMDMERSFAVKTAIETLKRAVDKADELGLGDIHICPETMGKINQLGNEKEIIEMCKIDERLFPTIDFGHLHCRNLGSLNSEKDFRDLLNMFLNELGYERMKNFHAHFSKMEFTQGGEKRHVTFEDKGYGPHFENLAGVLKELKLEPNIICESKDTMTSDAMKMKEIYMNLK